MRQLSSNRVKSLLDARTLHLVLPVIKKNRTRYTLVSMFPVNFTHNPVHKKAVN